MSIQVRPAQADDIGTLIEYNIRLAAETENKTLDRAILTAGVTRALEDPGRIRYWVAEDAATREVVGQVGATREWSDWRNGWVWWLQSVYVHAEYRGQGVFKTLLQFVKSEAMATPDVIGLRLYVEVNNHRARKTYESLGFHLGEYEVGEDLWLNRV